MVFKLYFHTRLARVESERGEGGKLDGFRRVSTMGVPPIRREVGVATVGV